MRLIRIERILNALLAVLCICLGIELYTNHESRLPETAQEEKEGKIVYREKLLTEESASLPSSYDGRDYGRAPIVKNQGTLGTCWAVTASSALEARLLPQESLVFSADHLSLQNSFAKGQNDGGDYTMIMAYLAGWQGPVLEADDPYGDGVSDGTLSAVKHVQEIQLLEEKDLESVKQAIYQYGGVQSSLYMDLENAFSSSVYYNQLEYSYYYPEEEKANHDILLIGWDDTYPAEKFNAHTDHDGAFICQNSWGSEFGENGVFYVSYDDVNITKDTVVYTDISDPVEGERLYQTDLCGWVGQLGYGDDTCYFANYFEAEQQETLLAAGFYATGPDTQYQITVLRGEEPLSDALLEPEQARGQVENAGYYRIELEEPVKLQAGERYAVVIRIQTPDSEYPVATEYAADEATYSVDLSDGDGYISHSGAVWSGAESEYGCNVCMKVYTKVESS